jgi:hypothetical protein
MKHSDVLTFDVVHLQRDKYSTWCGCYLDNVESVLFPVHSTCTNCLEVYKATGRGEYPWVVPKEVKKDGM